MNEPEPRPSVRQRWLGERLAEMRLAAGHTSLTSAAKALKRSAPSISRLENGLVVLPVRDFPPILDGYGVTDTRTRERILAIASEIQQERRGWWVEYADGLTPSYIDLVRLESTALSAQSWELQYIPGLLQTREYALNLGQALNQHDDRGQLEQFVDARMHRQSVLDRETGPLKLHAVLYEAILRQPVGTPDAFARQLRHLLERAEALNITLQALRQPCRPHSAMTGSFTLLELPSLTVAQVELLTSTVYVESEPDVARYQQAWNDLLAQALDPKESQRLIEQAIEDLGA
ncbi:helix-turn-helix transcriptional regulator [Nocardiopsis sp. FIRDI 009]|uniref:helix-turn-helix domain-containing protein n=1 Tax=Nocardiopsis sp. FIRDI 009 TaxID=714197 RepID=UPI0013007463|nr:helix-turn-helix transcriptional regulator [Nocardiopsis sp. FIRDI 009]